MKSLFGFLLVALMLMAPEAHALFPNNTAGQALLTKANVSSPLEGLGTVVNQNKNLIKCVYDFSVLGGVAGDIKLVDEQGNACVLPPGAIAARSYAYVVTALAGSQVSFGLLAHSDMKAFATLGSSGAAVEGALTGAFTAAVGPTTTASSQAFVTLANTLTAGKINLYIEYVY